MVPKTTGSGPIRLRAAESTSPTTRADRARVEQIDRVRSVAPWDVHPAALPEGLNELIVTAETRAAERQAPKAARARVSATGTQSDLLGGLTSRVRFLLTAVPRIRRLFDGEDTDCRTPRSPASTSLLLESCSTAGSPPGTSARHFLRGRVFTERTPTTFFGPWRMRPAASLDDAGEGDEACQEGHQAHEGYEAHEGGRTQIRCCEAGGQNRRAEPGPLRVVG